MERNDSNNTVQTNSSENNRMPEDFNPVMGSNIGRRRASKEGSYSRLKEFLPDIDQPDVSEEFGKVNDNADDTKNSIYADDTVNSTVPTMPKRISMRQRKESLEEYRETFLQVPILDDRKPAFISREVRDSLDEIVRRLGGRRMSVSGFIENLARHHLDAYREDIEVWRKL